MYLAISNGNWTHELLMKCKERLYPTASSLTHDLFSENHLSYKDTILLPLLKNGDHLASYFTLSPT